ncbi:hypothetical protein [Methylobacterium sp. Gmos1]
MKTKEIVERVAAMPARAPGVAAAPATELVAMVTRMGRGLRQWKKETLSDFAQVSLSTIERVERAEPVGSESLDRIARAFGHKPGAFTKLRVTISKEQAINDLVEVWGHLASVAMREFQTRRQVRMVAATQAYLIHRPELGSTYDGLVEELTGWLDLASMVTGPDVMSADVVGVGGPVRRRDFCDQVLATVTELQRRSVTVLVGVMDAPLLGIPDWTVTILSMTPKRSDPGASKRRTLLVDRRLMQPGSG